jgi:hypothetical protein
LPPTGNPNKLITHFFLSFFAIRTMCKMSHSVC